jgi:hypothetical protein
LVKLLVLLLGLIGGATTSAAWLLSEPDVGTLASPGGRLAVLKARIAAAMAEGEAAASATENKLRHELAAYRSHPDRPAVS